jgi:hypothetical protein
MTLYSSSGLHVRYEKAGLILDSLPIPWNADAVIVEANVRLPKGTPQKQDFTLQLSSGAPKIAAEVIGQDAQGKMQRVFFRLPPPAQTCRAEVSWREHSLGHIEMPMISAADFTQGLNLHMASLFVGLKGRAVPCQALVAGQCQTLSASAVLQSATVLAPAADLDINVRVWQGDRLLHTVPIAWTSALLSAKQALLTAFLPKLRRIGDYTISWYGGRRVLHSHRLKVVSKKRFLRSLRITATRFAVRKEDGTFEIVRSLPQQGGRPCLDGIEQLGPCFYVCSGEAGMAGLASFTCFAFRDSAEPMSVLPDEVTVTDGPVAFSPATLAASEVAQIKHFALRTSEGMLGTLPLVPAPSAEFTGEGGFTGIDNFLWTPAAEEQLNERLGKLLDEG